MYENCLSILLLLSFIHIFFAKQKRARIKTSIKSWARCDELQLVLTQSKNVCFFKGCSRRRRSSIWWMNTIYVERGGRHRVVWLMDLSSLWMQKREAKRKEREKKSITIQSVLGNCPVFFSSNSTSYVVVVTAAALSCRLVLYNVCVDAIKSRASIFRNIAEWSILEGGISILISIHSHENRWAHVLIIIQI